MMIQWNITSEDNLPQHLQRVLFYRETKLTKVGEMIFFDREPDRSFFIEEVQAWAEEINKPKDLSKQFSLEDMKEAFNAGEKFRLYLDKNAIGMGYLNDKNIPSTDIVLETMCFEKWIENK